MAKEGNGMFSIQSYYGVLRGPREISFPWRGIWCAKALKRVALFVDCNLGKILMNDNFGKRGIMLVCIGAVCVAIVGSQGTMSYCILILLMHFWDMSSVSLELTR